MGDYCNIRYERLGPVARILLDRPAKANAQSDGLLAEFDAALAEAANEAEIRVLILGAEGRHFSAGHDLADSIENRGDFSVEQQWSWMLDHYLGNAMRLRNFAKPTIAQVQGACVGAGFMLANCCDLLVAADDAYFADPVLHSMGMASVQCLIHPWVLGQRKAREMLFTGDRIEAVEAHRCGMANHVVPRIELEAFTLSLANRIAEAPPYGVRMLKRSLNRIADIQGFTSAIDAHYDTHVLSLATQELRDIIANGGVEAARKTSRARLLRDGAGPIEKETR